MSMNIAPNIPQVVVNASAPTTEALAKANASKEVIPAAVQTEAIVPQKSREQEARSPINNQDPDTYDDIRNNNASNNRVIAEDQESGEQNSQQEPEEQGNNEQQTADSANEEQKAQQQEQQEAQDQQVIDKLKARDREVRAHEEAHAAVGGSLAGSPSYEYQTGPDGNKYAVGGEVSIDVSKTNDPEATIRKMETVRAAALAPAEPSSQDRKVAAQASRNIAEARAELITETEQAEKPEAKAEEATSESSESSSNSNTDTQVKTEQTAGKQLTSDASSVQTVFAGETSKPSQNQFQTKVDLAKSYVSADNDDRTAQVVSQRYASAAVQKQNFFTAVA